MTANKSLNLNDIQYYGEHGNLSVAKSTFTFASPVSGDTVDLLLVPGGFEIVDAHIINAALTGTSATIELGHRHVDGTAGGSPSSIISATDAHTAGRINMDQVPVVEKVKDSIVYATLTTLAGDTIASAPKIDVVVNYRVAGTP
jgi:hypothetical protein